MTATERHTVLPVMETTILESVGVVMFGNPHCLVCGRPVRLADVRRPIGRWWHADVERRPDAWYRRRPRP